MIEAIILFVIGLVLLIKGGDWFVDGATGIARKFHLSDMIVGATVVSIGTTLPEVMVSATGASNGQGSMAYGNAIGSIICNTALIAAVSVSLRPGPVNVKTMKMPVAFFFLSAACYCIAAYAIGAFTRLFGVASFLIFVVYIILTIRQGLKTPAIPEENTQEKHSTSVWKEIFLLVIGAVLIAVGADLLVDNVTIIATQLGVPETVIALTFIALGTSLPESISSSVIHLTFPSADHFSSPL